MEEDRKTQGDAPEAAAASVNAAQQIVAPERSKAALHSRDLNAVSGWPPPGELNRSALLVTNILHVNGKDSYNPISVAAVGSDIRTGPANS